MPLVAVLHRPLNSLQCNYLVGCGNADLLDELEIVECAGGCARTWKPCIRPDGKPIDCCSPSDMCVGKNSGFAQCRPMRHRHAVRTLPPLTSACRTMLDVCEVVLALHKCLSA